LFTAPRGPPQPQYPRQQYGSQWGKDLGPYHLSQPSYLAPVSRQEPVARQERHEPPILVESRKVHEIIEDRPVVDRERIVEEYVPVVLREHEVVNTGVERVQEELPREVREVRETGPRVDVDEAVRRERMKLIPAQSSAEQITYEQRQCAPEIRERVIHKVIEDIQPVILRDVHRTRVIERVLPIHERVIDNPRIQSAVVMDRGRRGLPMHEQPHYQRGAIGQKQELYDSQYGGVQQTGGLGQREQLGGMSSAAPVTSYQSGGQYGGMRSGGIGQREQPGGMSSATPMSSYQSGGQYGGMRSGGLSQTEQPGGMGSAAPMSSYQSGGQYGGMRSGGLSQAEQPGGMGSATPMSSYQSGGQYGGMQSGGLQREPVGGMGGSTQPSAYQTGGLGTTSPSGQYGGTGGQYQSSGLTQQGQQPGDLGTGKQSSQTPYTDMSGPVQSSGITQQGQQSGGLGMGQVREQIGGMKSQLQGGWGMKQQYPPAQTGVV
jgi:hypothetical protein